MNLNVLHSDPPWYADGLKFTCTQCGNCCSGPRGYVWITHEEIIRLAEHLQSTPEEVVERYCRKVGGQFSLREVQGPGGQFDCIFLRDEPAAPVAAPSDTITHSRRTCGIYAARPLQCRTWPFWHGTLSSKQNWDSAAVRCHGMNRGRHFSLEEINALERAEDWPQHAPTS